MRPTPVASLFQLRSHVAVTALLIAGFFGAIALRVAIGQPDVSHSATAGLLFAACLILLTLSYGVKTRISKRIIITGFLGGLFLCLPALYFHLGALGNHTPAGNYFVWSLIIATVAFAEEAFIRGALYDKVAAITTQKIAIFVAATAFAILHLPLYGWHAMPLDFAVGIWLGALRLSSGSYVAPGIAHVVADLAAWWI
jgi:membrane protease YdiL (CAAX protease family)